MVHIYYRTNEAIARNPLAFSAPEEGAYKDDYNEVHTLANEDAPDLEDLFEMFQRVKGDELPSKLGIRSMMTGDVVVDEVGKVWFCASSGWEEISWD